MQPVGSPTTGIAGNGAVDDGVADNGAADGRIANEAVAKAVTFPAGRVVLLGA